MAVIRFESHRSELPENVVHLYSTSVLDADWRKLRSRNSRYTRLVEPDRYEDVFDAISAALRKGAGYVPGATEQTTLGHLLNTRDPGSALYQMSVGVVPTMPVQIGNAMRLAIGLLQYGLWDRADMFRPDISDRGPPASVLVPDPAALLKRKLIAANDELVDLAHFLIVPCSANDGDWIGPDLSILQFFERRPESRPKPALPILRDTRQRLLEQLEKMRTTRRWDGRKQTTKKFEQQLRRVELLLDSFP